MANHGPVYGLDAELQQKREAQYDSRLESTAKEWIEHVTGAHLGSDFHEALKSGVVLCNLVNKLWPGKIKKVSTGSMPFAQMENIAAYLAACGSLGLLTHDLFQTVDLFEAKNMNQVITNVHALKRVSERGSSGGSSSSSGGSGGGKFCNSCGTKGAAGAKFCPSCGTRM